MKLIALALVAAVAVYAAPNDDFVPESVIVHNDQLEEVLQPGEEFSLAEVSDMMNVDKNMSQEQMEAEFEQMIQGESDETKLAVAFSLQRVAKMPLINWPKTSKLTWTRTTSSSRTAISPNFRPIWPKRSSGAVAAAAASSRLLPKLLGRPSKPWAVQSEPSVNLS